MSNKISIIFSISGTIKENEKITAGFDKSLRLAEKYCSIYNTLTKVAEWETKILFI